MPLVAQRAVSLCQAVLGSAQGVCAALPGGETAWDVGQGFVRSCLGQLRTMGMFCFLPQLPPAPSFGKGL